MAISDKTVTGPADGAVQSRAAVQIRTVAFDAPWDWLAAGWRDLWAVPQVSLGYGAAFAVIAALLLLGLTQIGAQSIILALAGGFLLLVPLVARGIYEASRRLAAGEPVTLAAVALAGLGAKGQMSFMGIILMLLFLAWMQIAFLLFMLFTGAGAFPPAREFVPMLLFTPHGLGLLVAGTIAGGVLAAIVFSASAISIPMLMEREVDAVTAIATSFRAVRKNPKPMMLWAALIAAFMAVGLATLCAGLVFAFPLVGHATWHAYQDLTRKA